MAAIDANHDGLIEMKELVKALKDVSSRSDEFGWFPASSGIVKIGFAV